MLRTALFLLLSMPLFASCHGGNERAQEEHSSSKPVPDSLEKAYFASGCFWCVEHIYEEVKGVQEAVSGFAGGEVEDPSYRQVANGGTKHAETVKVIYDPDEVDFKTLVNVYYASQDPTTKGQDPDFGPQYRSIIFYQNEQEKRIAQAAKDSVASSGAYDEPIVTEIQKLDAFYKAKASHQDYVKKHPDRGYVRRVSVPRFERFKEKMPEVLK